MAAVAGADMGMMRTAGGRLARRWLVLAGLALGLLAACGAPAGAQITIEDAWARAAAVGMAGQGGAGPTSAVYLVIRNEGRAADRLTAARSDVARAAELHESRMDGGVMRMSPVPAIAVPAGGRVELRPGGLHIMLIDLQRELKAGERFPVILQFEQSGPITVQAEVRQP
jgi:copper(I)-binding protein